MQIEHPIERGIAAADDDDAPVPELLDLAHGVEDASALVGADVGNRRFLRLERAAAGRDDDHLRLERGPGVRANSKFGAFGCSQNLQRFHHLAEVKSWMERLDLQHEVVDQPLCGHHREAGNVVDRLLRIEFGALAADLGQNVDQMRLDVEQSELEDREQPRRPGADDRDVGGNSLAHFGHPCLAGVVTTRPSSAGVTLI